MRRYACACQHFWHVQNTCAYASLPQSAVVNHLCYVFLLCTCSAARHFKLRVNQSADAGAPASVVVDYWDVRKTLAPLAFEFVHAQVWDSQSASTVSRHGCSSSFICTYLFITSLSHRPEAHP